MPYKDPEKAKEQSKRYREANREMLKEKSKKYREENRDACRAWQSNYRKENKEKVLLQKKKYYQENKPKIREYYKEKYHTDSCYKLRKNVSRAIRDSLKGGKGGQSFLPYVDWTIEELREHLESQFEPWMTWENHGVYHPTEDRWHIDHVMPQSVLLEGVETMDHPKFRECWALENLQPLWAKENISKGNKIL